MYRKIFFSLKSSIFCLFIGLMIFAGFLSPASAYQNGYSSPTLNTSKFGAVDRECGKLYSIPANRQKCINQCSDQINAGIPESQAGEVRARTLGCNFGRSSFLGKPIAAQDAWGIAEERCKRLLINQNSGDSTLDSNAINNNSLVSILISSCTSAMLRLQRILATEVGTAGEKEVGNRR